MKQALRRKRNTLCFPIEHHTNEKQEDIKFSHIVGKPTVSGFSDRFTSSAWLTARIVRGGKRTAGAAAWTCYDKASRLLPHRKRRAPAMTLMEQLAAYIPYNEQEARDARFCWTCLRREPEVLTRKNPLAHFTASAWIVNSARTRVLMAYHNNLSFLVLAGRTRRRRERPAGCGPARGARGKRHPLGAPGLGGHLQPGGAHRGRARKARGLRIVPTCT